MTLHPEARLDLGLEAIGVLDAVPHSPPVHTILFLAGRRSGKELWSRTLRELSSIGHRAIAIDLPAKCTSTQDKISTFQLLFRLLGIRGTPVLVTVASSGKYALPLLERNMVKGS
eukprot:sb/3476794/